MLKTRYVAWLVSIATFLPAAGVPSAQTYPDRPIRILTSPAGGGSDFVTQFISQGLTSGLGQPVIIDRRDGVTAILTVAHAAPDGYTLLFYASAMWLMPFFRRDIGYDPLKNFVAVSATDRSPNVLIVNPSSGINSVAELIAKAKASPGVLNYSMGAVGSPTHLSSELFNVMAGIKTVAIAYKGGAPAVQGLMGGDTQFMFSTALTTASFIKSGKIKALAVTSESASTLFPGMPTVAETVPGYSADLIEGIFAPGGTPSTIVNALNREIVKTLANKEVKEKFVAVGSESVGTTPEQFEAIVKADMDKWGKLIKALGIRAE